MKKLTAILGLAAALTLAGCPKITQELIVSNIDAKKTFCAKDYSKFLSNEYKGKGFLYSGDGEEMVSRSYDMGEVHIEALFKIKKDNSTEESAKAVWISSFKNPTVHYVDFTPEDGLFNEKETKEFYYNIK
jgi:hypothetical protein